MLFTATGLTISAFSVYLPYIRATNGFSNAQTTMLLTVRSLTSLITMAVVDRFYHKMNLKLGGAVAVAGVGISFFLYGIAGNYVAYCAAAALCGLSYGLSGTTAASMMIDVVFKENKASALGIASAGTGVASIISPVIIVPLIEKGSLRTAFFAEAAFVIVCAVLVFLLAQNQKNSAGPKNAEVAVAGNKRSKTSLLKLSKGHAAFFLVSVFLGGFVVYGVTGFMSMLYREKFTGSEMSLLVSVFGIALMFGKIAYGRLADKLGTYIANFFLFVFLIVGLVGSSLASSFYFALVMAVFLGAGTTLANVAIPVYARNFAAPGMTVKAVKNASFTMAVSGLCISAVSGALADIFGSYVPVFLIMAGISAVSGILIQYLYIKNKMTGLCRDGEG